MKCSGVSYKGFLEIIQDESMRKLCDLPLISLLGS